MYIKEGYRRKRLATLLISFLENELTKMGVSTIKILTNRKNIKAIKTYIKSGYNTQDEIIMSKEN